MCSLAPSPSYLLPSPSSLVPSPSSLISSSSSLAPHPPLLYHSCRVIYGVIEFSIYMWAYQRFHFVDLPWDSAWTWWLCFLAYDMGYYFFHRYAHGRPIPAVKVRVRVALLCIILFCLAHAEVNLFWAAHQVHHSSEEYNLSTALRQSSTQGLTSWVRRGKNQ